MNYRGGKLGHVRRPTFKRNCGAVSNSETFTMCELMCTTRVTSVCCRIKAVWLFYLDPPCWSALSLLSCDNILFGITTLICNSLKQSFLKSWLKLKLLHCWQAVVMLLLGNFVVLITLIWLQCGRHVLNIIQIFISINSRSIVLALGRKRLFTFLLKALRSLMSEQ